MPISGLVLSLSADTHIQELVTELSTDPRLRVGDPVGHRLPLVSETADAEADRLLWDTLSARPEVLHIDVAFIHFDEVGSDRS